MKQYAQRLLILMLCLVDFGCADDDPPTPPIEEWCDLDRPREDCVAGDLIISHGLEDAKALCETSCSHLGDVLVAQGDEEIFKAFGGFHTARSIRIGNSHHGVTDLRFLKHFKAIGYLAIIGNNNIESLDGLEWIEVLVPNDCEGCGSSIVIEGNPRLRSLNALRNLREVGGITIEHNDALEVVNGFSKLESGRVKIMFNHGLKSIAGFEQMREIDSNITIRGNSNLSKVDAWPNLRKLNALFVDRNRNLDECEVQRILDQLDEPPGTITIADNGAPCMP